MKSLARMFFLVASVVLIVSILWALLACGTAAPAPGEFGVTQAPAQNLRTTLESTPEPAEEPERNEATAEEMPTPEPTATPAPRPTECVEWQDDTGTITPLCYTQSLPHPTRKYPKLGDGSLEKIVLEHEEAELRRASGAEGASSVSTERVLIIVYAKPGRVQEVVDWLKKRDTRDIEAFEASNQIYVYLPVSELVALSELEAVHWFKRPAPLY